MSASIAGNTISLTRGDSLRVQIHIYNDEAEYTPAAGDTVRFALKKKVTDPEPLILKSIPIDTLVLAIDPADTKDLQFGTYRYDIELTTAAGFVNTFIGPAPFVLTEEVH